MFRTLVVLLICAGWDAFAQTAVEPIRLDQKNPHYFRYQQKTIVLLTSGEHYGSVINADFDFDKYLTAIQACGFNYTRIFCGSYVEAPGKSFGIRRNTLAPLPGKFIAPWARGNEAGYQGGGNRFDLDRWNPEYFRRLHTFLDTAQKRGIIVELTLFSSQYGELQWSWSVFNPANNGNRLPALDWKNVNTLENGDILRYQEQYTRRLVREANPFPNVIFEIQNEPWSDRGTLAGVINPYLSSPARDQYPNSIDLSDAKSLAWQQRVAEWIVSEEATLANHHLIAQNYCNFRFPVSNLIPAANIVNFHYAYPDAVTLNYGLGKGIAYDETGFLGQADGAYRRQAWNFMLSGGSAFDALDYSFTPGREDGSDTDPNGPGGGSPALRKQLSILHDFLRKLPLADMAPDTHTVIHATGVFVRALSTQNGVYAFYLDGDGPVRLTLKLAAGVYQGEWINVETGESTGIAPFTSKGESALDTPEFTNGLALHLTRRTIKGYHQKDQQ